MSSTTPTWFESSAQSFGSTSHWATNGSVNGSVNSSDGSSSSRTTTGAAPTTSLSNGYCSWVCTGSTATETTAVVGIVANQYANFYIGVILGIAQSVGNGFSFLFNKKAQQRLIKRGYGAGSSLRYVCDWMWWVAMVLLVASEAMNFVAYIFAPATVVAPLGALQIVACAIIAWIFLKEHLNVFGMVGCVLTIFGTTLIVLFAPESDALANVWDLWLAFLHPAWLVYLGIIVVVNIALISYVNPKWGKKVVFIPVTVTASVASITVMTAKGLGVGLSELFKGDLFPLKFWFTYVILACGAASVVLQIVYLNMAIAQYNINLVAPILYVEFTSLTITAGAILFNELSNLQYQAIIALAMGFAVIVVGLFLITSFKDLKFSWRDWFFFMFKRKQTEAANAAAEDAAANGDHQQLGESSGNTPEGNAEATGAAGEQAAGGEASDSPDSNGGAEQRQESAEGDLATPKTNEGTDIPDGSAPSPAAPTAASTAASIAASTSAAAEAAPESPPDPNRTKKMKSILDLFRRKKDKGAENADAGEKDKETSGARGEEKENEKDTVRDSLKKTWYRITDLNAFGSRGKHNLLHSSKHNSQLDLSGSRSAPATGNLPPVAAGFGAVPTVTVNGGYDNAGADMSELPGQHEMHLQLGDGENDDVGGDQLAASSHSAKMLLGVQQLHELRRDFDSSDGHQEGSVFISELPSRPPPLYTFGEVNSGFEVPTPRANNNPFAPNAQTPRGSQSSGSTPRVEIAMVGVPSTSSVAPVYSNRLDAPSIASRISGSSSPRDAAVTTRSSPAFPQVAAVEWSQPFNRAPSIAESSASYSLDALAGAAFEDRSRARLPSDTSSVVTVRAAVPLAGGAHVAANGFFQPLPPQMPVTTAAADGRVDFV